MCWLHSSSSSTHKKKGSNPKWVERLAIVCPHQRTKRIAYTTEYRRIFRSSFISWWLWPFIRSSFFAVAAEIASSSLKSKKIEKTHKIWCAWREQQGNADWLLYCIGVNDPDFDMKSILIYFRQGKWTWRRSIYIYKHGRATRPSKHLFYKYLIRHNITLYVAQNKEGKDSNSIYIL